MAIVIPNRKHIMEAKVKPTEGELTLLEKLERELDNSYTIFFRAYLNGGHPDIIVFKKGYGLFIIETRDWELDNYKYEGNIRKYGRVKIKKGISEYIIENPIRRVQGYKDSLYNLHSYKLAMLKLKSEMYYGLVKTGIYFYKESEERVCSFFKSDNKDCNRVRRFGYDSDIVQAINDGLKYGDYKLYYIFEQLEKLLRPKYHKGTNIDELKLNVKQKALIRSKEGVCKKVKGESGAGKSIVIAYRAVDVFRRNKNSKILILTFNMTLRNYLKDKISEVRGEFNWNSLNIIHFYGFMAQQNEKYGVLEGHRDDYENLDLEAFKDLIIDEKEKYDAILIDEGQDFKYEWFKCLKENFLKDNGEFLIFADEKQNIYGRILEEKLVRTNIRGDWGELRNSYRLKGKLLRLAYEFQSEFYKDKYKLNLELLKERQLVLDITDEEVEYSYLENIELEEILHKVKETIAKERVNINDITILGDRIEELRGIENYVNEHYGIACETVFEREEDYKYLREKTDLEIRELEDEIKEQNINVAVFKNEEGKKIIEENMRKILEVEKSLNVKLESLRKIKRFGFNQNNGKLKISTTHSFKGWESDYVILILEKDHKNTTPELIYTAITRCRKKLIIYNRGNKEYNTFFEKINPTFNIKI